MIHSDEVSSGLMCVNFSVYSRSIYIQFLWRILPPDLMKDAMVPLSFLMAYKYMVRSLSRPCGDVIGD